MNRSFLYALWICFIVAAPCIIIGITAGFSSIAVPELNLSLAATSWFSSLNGIAAPFGCLMTGLVIDRYGRKRALVLCSIPGTLGWLIMAIRRDTMILFLGRILTGLSSGAAFFPAQVYMAEYIDLNPKLIHLRSSFANWAASAIAFGFLIVALLGSLFPYYVVAFITFVVSLFALCGMLIFIPESPIWLYENGRYGDAEWSLKCLKLSTSLEHYSYSSISTKKGNDSTLEKLFRPNVYLPLLITTALTTLMVLSGLAAFSAYLVNMIDLGESYSLQDSYYLSVLSSALQFIATLAVVFVIPITGIRKIAIGSAFGIIISLLTYGIAVYYITYSAYYRNIAYDIAIAAIYLQSLCYGFGFATIPKGILGELFPTDAKGFAVVPTIALFVCESFVIKVHPYLVASIGGLVYFVYAAFTVIDALLFYFFLPETVGKTTRQINLEFCK